MYRFTEIIKDKDPLSQSHSLHIVMVGVSHHCPFDVVLDGRRQRQQC